MVKRARRCVGLPVLICVTGMPLFLSGCTNFALDDGIPNTAPPAVVVGPRTVARPVALTRLDTGTYPTFGRPLTAANTQIGDEEYTRKESQLSALAAARANGSISEAEYQRRIAALRRLASDHAGEAERQITN
ncbi:SHOCT domain-containing protein [Rhizobium sp. SSA_523]|uniref:SHOCT domain-containing protein n=1 Tax=Rhizobium sp. SSA_523 TaxID=2952477 RepID=UPI002090183B|nr:SHOCT domain-containing protein [Rhizobium sp. SSA_523]MCO5734078.1 SHOCT domain-containing protein [Rhizobium sp. SSA_523]WKC24716.1 SHOCT domain-containing protein [Rhizobium sp. SSA_523]